METEYKGVCPHLQHYDGSTVCDIDPEFRSYYGLRPEIIVPDRPVDTSGADYSLWLSARRARHEQINEEIIAQELADNDAELEGFATPHAPAWILAMWIKKIDSKEVDIERLLHPEEEDFDEIEEEEDVAPKLEMPAMKRSKTIG